MTRNEARKTGAVKNPRRARKSRYYSEAMSEAERLEFSRAAGVEGIDEEIALLRLEIRKALAGGDDRTLLLLIKATTALEKLIRTRYKIEPPQHKGLKDALGNVVRDVLVPLGVNVGSAIISKKVGGA